jgi:hypothetical protein
MALTKTTLNGAIAFDAAKLVLTSATGIAKNMLLRVDGEFCKVTDISLSPTLGVVRGVNGTSAIAHNTLAIVAYGVTGDFSNPLGASGQSVTSYSVSGAITVPVTDQTVIINKASAAAMTLAAPAADTNPFVLITSASAAAHTVTGVALLADGTAATPKSTATFGTQAGATITLEGVNGLWNVVSLENVTIA